MENMDQIIMVVRNWSNNAWLHWRPNTYLKAYMKTKGSTLAWGRRVNGWSGWALGQQLLGADVERTQRWSDCRVRATGLSSDNSIEREREREREREGAFAGGVARKRKDSVVGFFFFFCIVQKDWIPGSAGSDWTWECWRCQEYWICWSEKTLFLFHCCFARDGFCSDGGSEARGGSGSLHAQRGPPLAASWALRGDPYYRTASDCVLSSSSFRCLAYGLRDCTGALYGVLPFIPVCLNSLPERLLIEYLVY
jgi:hypothetical protein